MLSHDYRVIGIDNYSKYGRIARDHDKHPRFTLINGDIRNIDKMNLWDTECDTLIAAAAMIGGIQYFHQYAYDLLATNERILASTFDFAIDQYRKGMLKKILVISSSMVFENASTFPTAESEILKCPVPSSTYGFQKLASEFFCKGALEQYGLPYSIIRPFNCIGLGEGEMVSIDNTKITMSHIVPDIIDKCFNIDKNQPLPILGSGDQVRHYTYGGDIAFGIRLAMENDAAINQDFNISSDRETTVKEVCEIIWRQVHGDVELKFTHLPPFKYDVQMRSPDVSKAKNVLGFQCKYSLEQVIHDMVVAIRGFRNAR